MLALALLVLPRPAAKFLLELEKGYSLETLGYVPGAYSSIPDDAYLNIGSGAAEGGLLEVKSNNATYYLTFRQMRNSPDLNSLRNANFLVRNAVRGDTTIDGNPGSIYSSSEGTKTFIWTKENKRYEVETNDSSISEFEVARMAQSLTPLKVDIWEPVGVRQPAD